MKRYNDLNWFLLIIFITTGFWMVIEFNQIDNQEVIATLSGINQKLDWCGQCSEVMTASVVEEPVMSDCPVYCNSVSCRCDEEAYKERDKMSNDDPNKFMYIEEQWINNYFDRTKVK